MLEPDREYISSLDDEQVKQKVLIVNKKFKGLYDALYISAHIGYNDRALVSHYTLSGVSQKNADAFLRKMLGVIQWP